MDNEKKYWIPLTNDKLDLLKEIVCRAEYILQASNNKPQPLMLEKLHSEIDTQIILTANWLGTNKVPNVFYYSSLLKNAKKLGVLKKEIEFILPNSNYGEFENVAEFYGALQLDKSENINTDFNDYNEVQHNEFLASFSGRLKTKISFFRNGFDSVSEEDVYQHFKINLVDCNYLSEEDLKQYLRLAFQHKKKPANKIQFKNNPSKALIRKVFRDYQNDLSKNQYKKSRYVKLLTEYFNGFKLNNTTTNWAK